MEAVEVHTRPSLTRLAAAALTATAVVVLVLLRAASAAGAEEIAEPTFEGVPLSAAGLQPADAGPADAPAPLPEVRASAAEAPNDEPTYNGVPLSRALTDAVATPAPRPVEVAAPPTGTGRHVVYSVSQQRVWLVEDGGEVSRTYLVSGRAGIPRPGSYTVFSKSERAFSGAVSMRHMIRFARGTRLAIGFHSIPVRRNGTPLQSLAELGRYRSSGCVRQAPADAEHLWRWAPVGTRVVVLR